MDTTITIRDRKRIFEGPGYQQWSRCARAGSDERFRREDNIWMRWQGYLRRIYLKDSIPGWLEYSIR